MSETPFTEHSKRHRASDPAAAEPSANGTDPAAAPSRYDEQTGEARPLLDLIRSKLADERGELPADRQLVRVVKRGRERPSYELHLANGEYAGPLTAAQLLKPANVREAMLVAASRAVPPVGTSAADWTRVAEWIDEAAEVADTVRESEETREWLASFLEVEDPRRVPLDDAARLARQLRDGPRDTFRGDDERLYLKLSPLSRHVRIHLGAKTTQQDLTARLTRLGFKGEQLSARDGDTGTVRKGPTGAPRGDSTPMRDLSPLIYVRRILKPAGDSGDTGTTTPRAHRHVGRWWGPDGDAGDNSPSPAREDRPAASHSLGPVAA